MTRNRLFAAVIALLMFGAALGLDLLNRGLMWRFIYSQTGEESLPGQIVGVMEWSGRWFRVQPETAPYVPVNHAGAAPFGINVFLEQEADLAVREESVRLIADAGFVWLRQEFPWEDIEIHERGDFTDRRNDRDGDGDIDENDIISAWEKYDNIVDLVEKYDLRLMVRLSNPPSWTHASEDAGDKGPPDDIQDYVNYAVAVAERYRGRITHYQIWNEPNIYPEWGNRDVSPVDYVDMLCRTYDALKAVDPEIVVVSGAIAPTVSMSYRDLNDFIYLELFFEAGGGECFDVMSMQGYGLNSGPTDHRMRATTINFARVEYIRDFLVKWGYADKAIWISEAAWNPVPPDVPDISNRETYGVVTEEQAARYMVEAYERQQQDWSYTGVMFYWFFKRASDAEANQSWYYFRMMEPDFTPLPVYDAIKTYTENLTPALYRGTHQADHWAISYPTGAEIVGVGGAEFDQATQTTDAVFEVQGTELAIRWQGGGALRVLRDGVLLNTLASDDEATYTGEEGWHEIRLRLGWTSNRYTIQLEATENTMLLDSVTVYDNSARDLTIIVVGGVVVIALLLAGLFARRSQPSGVDQ